MNKYTKPVLVASKCLGFDHCRYNGAVINDDYVAALKSEVDFITVCPEVEIGLGVPRNPIRIARQNNNKVLYQPATGKYFTDQMKNFSSKFLNSLDKVDGFILKFKSPSCALYDAKIYSSIDPQSMGEKGSGFFGEAVIEKFPHHPKIDEGRLKNFTIRENFYINIFCLAEFNKIRLSPRINDLVNFHTRNKLLFLAKNEKITRIMGSIVANHPQYTADVVFELYQTHLWEIINSLPKFNHWINTMLHAFGGISKHLNAQERKYFLDAVEEYRDERIPLSVPLSLLQSWAIRFNLEYLLHQTFLKPFPSKLVEISDSGKGRNH
ncbi:MAG: hypothetical protein APR63_00600 [Desulfuromonas sp. SDB]|nr:MAG: hypothetical protein APR63_00600 [Desulfuromonas sp. SDB]